MPKPPRFTTTGPFFGDDVTLAAFSGGGATGTGPIFLSAEYHTLRLNVSGVSFTGGASPTVTPIVETSADGSTWATLNPVSGTLGALSAAGTAHVVVTGLDRYTRARYTTTGAPTAVNMTISGEAV